MSGQRLLAVDDEEDLGTMLEAALLHHGFDVLTAETGCEALERLRTDEPDPVVLDVIGFGGMPRELPGN